MKRCLSMFAAILLGTGVAQAAYEDCPDKVITIHNYSGDWISYLYAKCRDCNEWTKLPFEGHLEYGDSITLNLDLYFGPPANTYHGFYLRADTHDHYVRIGYFDVCRETNIDIRD